MKYILSIVGVAFSLCEAVASPCGWPTALPFICAGQAIVGTAESTVLTNPPVNTPTGLLSACTALPYTVPANWVLTIDAMHIEGSGYGMDIAPYVGANASAPPRIPILLRMRHQTTSTVS